MLHETPVDTHMDPHEDLKDSYENEGRIQENEAHDQLTCWFRYPPIKYGKYGVQIQLNFFIIYHKQLFLCVWTAVLRC